jgi:hypothetical protein
MDQMICLADKWKENKTSIDWANDQAFLPSDTFLHLFLAFLNLLKDSYLRTKSN